MWRAGISAYANNPPALQTPLRRCLDYAVEQVPAEQYASTLIFLGATAGMRLLPDAQQNAILTVVRALLASYPFRFTQENARVISGVEEGAYGWIATNYLLGNFARRLWAAPVPQTVGALDLGGASTQIAFAARNLSAVPVNDTYSVHLFGMEFTIYSHSYLHYGLTAASTRFGTLLASGGGGAAKGLTIPNPCVPLGYNYTDRTAAPNVTFIGASDASACAANISRLFNTTAPCAGAPGHCPFDGVYQPASNGTFYAFSGFVPVVQFLNVSVPLAMPQFRAAAGALCNRTWAELRKNASAPVQYLPFYCFQAQYVLTLLSLYGLGRIEDTPIIVQNAINNTVLGWAMGFMIQATNMLPVDPPPATLRLLGVGGATAVGAASVGLLLAAAVAWYARRRQRTVVYAPLSA